MAYTSEIEKLEKRWAENPKGRNFAPLADAYRKAGELDRALELCKAGLDRHPDYVSAHIVYGRCLIDQKNDPGASEVFRKVLALDPENVLALKILAEIAERGGRFDEAVDWLGRLIAADPMNGDAAEALTRAKGKATQAASKRTAPVPAVTAPEPVVRLVPEAGPAAAKPAPSRAATPVPGRGAAVAAARTPSPPSPPPPPSPSPPPPVAAAPPDFVVEHASEGPTSPDLQVKGAPADIETFDGTLDFNAVAHSAARADGIEVQEEVELKAQDLVVEGLAHTQYESGLFATRPGTAEPEDDLPRIDLPLIMPDDVVETPPSVAEEAPPFAAAPRASAAPGGTAAAPPAPPPAAVALSDDDGAADTAALSRAEPVLTETMAELYLRQGHHEDALRVYQALLARQPGDRRLQARVEALTGGGSGQREGGTETGESVPAFLKRILAGRPGAPAPEAAARHGRSPLSDAFAIAHSISEPEPDVLAPGAATRPAGDSISLDQVFGDEGPRSSAPAAEPPALAAPPAASPPPTAAQTGGFSFDQFFSPSEPAERTSTAPATSAGGGPPTPQPPTRGSGGALRPSIEDEGDLDQFQAWLKGLKS